MWFDFPSWDGVHAVVTDVFRPTYDPDADTHQKIRIRFSVEGADNLVAYNQGQSIGKPACVSLFLQQQGDNLTASGAYVNYRQYTDEFRELTNGVHEWIVPVAPEDWHNVYGGTSEDGFEDCLRNLRVFGLVFGNPGRGATAHGVGGGGRFYLLSLELL